MPLDVCRVVGVGFDKSVDQRVRRGQRLPEGCDQREEGRRAGDVSVAMAQLANDILTKVRRGRVALDAVEQ